MKQECPFFVKENGKLRQLAGGVFASVQGKDGMEIRYFEGAQSATEIDPKFPGRIGISVKNIQTKHRIDVESTL